MPTGWNSDLTPLMGRISQVATGGGVLRVMTAGARLALALPAQRRAARVVAELYQPQRLKGRLFLALAKIAIASGLARWLPAYQFPAAAAPQAAWLQAAAAMGSVGFLGCNPNHGPRCVLAGIDPDTGAKFVAKLGLAQSAAAVRREAAVLHRLHGKFPGVVGSLGLETRAAADGGHSGNIIPPPAGVLSADPAAVAGDWALLRLPHLGIESPKSMADVRITRLLEQWLGGESFLLGERPWSAALIAKVPLAAAPAGWHQRMRSLRIRGALLHGDFAVWNLRVATHGLVAIDWEWADENAVAGMDLAHGLRQECYMVRGMPPPQAVPWMLAQAASAGWREYLKLSGWGDACEDWLRLGLLHSHFNALNPSADLLGELGIRLEA